MSWKSHTQQKFGYQVDDRFYSSKLDALQAAGSLDSVSLYFLDQEWKHVDWTTEPTESWQHLVDRRCLQLRDKYSFLSLFFSGGYDSITIANAFLRNNICIDEFIIWERPWIPDTGNEIQYALDIAKKIKKDHWPNLKIIVHSRNIQSLKTFYVQHGEDWISHPGESFAVTTFMRNWDHQFYKELQGKNEKKGHGLIEGRDKPRLDFVNGKWYSAMNDKLLKYCMGSSSEQFYFAENMPELHVKQCHMMIDWLENTFDVTHELVHQIQSRKSGPKVYEQWNLAVGRDPVFNESARYGLGVKSVQDGGLLSVDCMNSGNQLEKIDKKAFAIWKNGIECIKDHWPTAWNESGTELRTVIAKNNYIRDYRPGLSSKKNSLYCL